MAKPVTLKLDNVPVGVALHYTCELARVSSKVDPRLVQIVAHGGEEGLVKRTFYVDPGFVESAVNAGIIPPPQTQ